jgi:hypothetical protein
LKKRIFAQKLTVHELTSQEWEYMSSQIVMTSQAKRPKSAYPFAFTEHGVTMLSSVLRSDAAIETSILIVRAFVAIRQALYPAPPKSIEERIRALEEANEELLKDINDLSEDTRLQLELINETLAELQSKNQLNRPRNPIGFKIDS